MAFETGYLADIQSVDAGEEYGVQNRILGQRQYAEGLMVGRFARVEAGVLTPFDGTAVTAIAGVVIRNRATAVETGGVIDVDLTTGAVSYMQDGLVTVTVN